MYQCIDSNSSTTSLYNAAPPKVMKFTTLSSDYKNFNNKSSVNYLNVHLWCTVFIYFFTSFSPLKDLVMISFYLPAAASIFIYICVVFKLGLFWKLLFTIAFPAQYGVRGFFVLPCLKIAMTSVNVMIIFAQMGNKFIFWYPRTCNNESDWAQLQHEVQQRYYTWWSLATGVTGC